MRSGSRSTEPLLKGAARQWPTPTTMDMRKSGGNPNTTGTHGTTLTDATVRMWGTPAARDEQRSVEAALAKKASFGRTEITSLNTQVKMWGTPNARDRKGSPSPKSTHVSLVKQATRGPRIEETTTDGPDGSPKVDLNPFFVATLMGLPMDWLTLSTSEVTASCLRQLHTPSDSYLTAAGGS